MYEGVRGLAQHETDRHKVIGNVCKQLKRTAYRGDADSKVGQGNKREGLALKRKFTCAGLL